LLRKVEQLQPEAIAVVLLYSYVNPKSENLIAEALSKTGIPISVSHKVHPEFREYERTSATVINAYLTPIMSSYVSGLAEDPLVKRGHLTVMQSNGGTISPGTAASNPIRTLFSGPAGGVTGAFEIAKQTGYDRVITLDMGGTSTDVALCDGEVATTTEANISHLPVPVPMINIHTVGTGGGSIAWIDGGGLLRVGPESAGANPGPVCYGKGTSVTVTDADLFLGMLDVDWFLGGDFELFPAKVKPALVKLGRKLEKATGQQWQPTKVADGIREIVSTQLESAVRVISLEKGYDTRDFTLVGFGGAAGLHACDVARNLRMPRALIPANPGLLSAYGILTANIQRDTSRTVLINTSDKGLKDRLHQSFRPLQDDIRKQLKEDGFTGKDTRIDLSVDLRYVGQSYELNVAFTPDYLYRFHEKHEQRYGYSNAALPVDIVTLRVKGTGLLKPIPLTKRRTGTEKPSDKALLAERPLSVKGRKESTKFYLRHRLTPGNRIQGPCIILEYSATTYVPADFQLSVDEHLNMVLETAAATERFRDEIFPFRGSATRKSHFSFTRRRKPRSSPPTTNTSGSVVSNWETLCAPPISRPTVQYPASLH
jgi:N-methylhydantoinase A